jgi:dynein heavy chain
LAGATQVELTKPNPCGENGWLTDKSWLSILEMSSKFETFKGFDDSFAKDIKQWEKIYNSANPQSFKENPWPAPWNDLKLLEKVNIMRCIRQDKVTQMIQKIVKKQKELGPDYLLPPSFSMEDLFNDSTNKSPIIIVISPGADPMTEIANFSKKKKIAFDSLSLGKGQDKKAI